MQPLQYTISAVQLRKTIYARSRGPSNLDAAITMRSAQTELRTTIELRAMVSEIAAPKYRVSTPKQKSKQFWNTFNRNFKQENHQRQNWENLVTNHHRSLDSAINRSPMSSCERQKYYARSRDPSNLDAAIKLRSAQTEMQSTK